MKWLLSLVLLAPAGFAQGRVLVVDSGGGGAYPEIYSALQDAVDGDVVLVKAGGYAGFGIANLSVAIVGDLGANPQVSGTIQARNLVAGRTVLLHGLRATGATSASDNDGPGITIKNDAGAVRVQQCVAQGAPGKPGVQVENSSDLALSDTQAWGGVEWEFSGAGVLANGTAIALYDCDLHGGVGHVPVGGQPPWCHGGGGGTALQSSVPGFVFAAGTLLTGGHGEDGAPNCYPYPGWDCCSGGNGGSGIDVLVGAHTLWQLENVYQPGSGGVGGFGYCGCGLTTSCQCDYGSNGSNVASNTDDTLVNLSGLSPTLGLGSNPARENTSVGITLDSAPGDAVLLVASSDVSFVPDPNRGVRLVDWTIPHFTRRLGTTDAQGHLQNSWAIPDLGPGVESQIVHLQALVVHSDGSRVWSNPVALVLLDSAF
jgi:hypothetical protein